MRQGRDIRPAALRDGKLAPRREPASVPKSAHIGRHAADRDQIPIARLAVHGRGQHGLGIRVTGTHQDIPGCTVLDDAPPVHDRHLVRDLSRHTKIMGDKNHRHAKFLLQLAQQQQNLNLHGRIQRCRRLIREQQARFA